MTHHNPSGQKRWGLRLAAGLGAAAIGAATIGAPAFAAPEFGDIDFDRADASLTIHKHEFQAGVNNPPVIADPEGSSAALPNPIAGVTFTAYPITSLPLNVSTSWDTLAEIDPLLDAVCPVPNTGGPLAELDGQILGAGYDFAQTDTDGIATRTLPVAAYLVCETAFAPTDLIDRPAQPFIVTIPFPDNQADTPSQSNGWLYQVHAYPKNTLAVDVEKTVNETTSFGLGTVASFPTTTGIPRIADDAQFTRYTVVDPMDPRLTDIGVSSVTITGGPVLVENTDYTIVRDRNVLMVQFTQAGLGVLKANGGREVVTVFQGTVSSLADDNGFGLAPGEIYNRAHLVTDHETLITPPPVPELPPIAPPTDPDNPDEPVDPTDPFDPTEPTPPGPPPSEVVEQFWGDIKLWKFDSAGTGDDANQPLNGAVFEVYEAAVPYPAAGTACAIDIAAGATPISVNNATTFTSANGIVTIPGLFVADSENYPVGTTTRCYVVKEITAPAGFVLPDGNDALTAVTVEIGETAVTAATGVGADASIANVKQSVPELPVTGAQGQLLMMVGGGVLVALGLGAALMATRRNKAKASA